MNSAASNDSLRRLCFGGSFNPIHNGHLLCAKAAARYAKFQIVTLVPSAQPPHKSSSVDLADPDDRLAMCHLAAEYSTDAFTRFETNDIELRRAGPSYTIATARQLKSQGWREVWWLIGADMLNYLPRWHEADRLIDEVNFLILQRPGIELAWQNLPADWRERLEPNIVPAPLIDVSATEIRRRIRAGEPIDAMIAPPVADYIRARGLYR